LLVTAATIYLTLLGPHGLTQVAATCVERTAQLVAALTRIAGVRSVFEGPRFHEAVLGLDRPVRGVLDALATRGIVGGYDLTSRYPALGPSLLVCATETRTGRDIERYAAALSDVLQSAAAA
jgi:glycine dehydrogenase subunit 1